MADDRKDGVFADEFSEDIDSVLSARRRQAAGNPPAQGRRVPPPASGVRMGPGSIASGPAHGAPLPGQRINRQPQQAPVQKVAPPQGQRIAPRGTVRPAPGAGRMPPSGASFDPMTGKRIVPPVQQRPAPQAPQNAPVQRPAPQAPQNAPVQRPVQQAPQSAPVQTPAQQASAIPPAQKTSPQGGPVTPVVPGQRIAPAQKAEEAPVSAPKSTQTEAPVKEEKPAPNAEAAPAVRTYALPGQKKVEDAPEKEAVEVKAAGRKMRDDRSEALRIPVEEEEQGSTRVTDMSEKVVLKKRSKKKDGDTGSTIVSGLMRTVIYLVTCTVIAVVLSIFIINVGNDVFAFVKSDEAVDVTIPENATRDDIADILYENGVINYKAAFKIYGKLKNIEENFVAGEYTVTPMMNYKSLYNAFKKKPVSGTTWITVPEGYTADEIIDLMLSYGIGGSKEEYVKAINEGDFSEFWFVKELEENGYDEDRFYRLEGYLFPDTYEFYNASSAETVIRKFLRRFSEVYNDGYRARAEELGLTTDQIVMLASMIEKEAGLSSDFRNVSSVFHNRIASSDSFPYFSSDATAVYAIQHDTGERPKHVTAEMMEYDSPYNTYTHPGFPPGAIANPGMNALKYALYPADTYYYYFVSLPSGETLFATNAADHEYNVSILRQMTADD